MEYLVEREVEGILKIFPASNESRLEYTMHWDQEIF